MDHEGLQAVPEREAPEVVPGQQAHWKKSYGNVDYSQDANKAPLVGGVREKRICGLRRATFLLALLLALAVVAAAVFGGVLGSRKTTTKRFVALNTVEAFKRKRQC